MIRDPSDGSVKPDPISSGPQVTTPVRNEINGILENLALKVTISGLPPTSAKAAYLARLEASRKWLKGYAARPVETIEGAVK